MEVGEKKLRYERKKETYETRAAREYRKVPSKRLVARLGLKEFDCKAPMTEANLNVNDVHIALGQSVGAPCEPVVSVGDQVAVGQMIGKIPDGKLGAPVHASISGRVLSITDRYIEIGG